MSIPVTVIGGYLGAGKTTLVNQLLRQAGGRRLAVMVNDFGSLPIDADLIEGEHDGVVTLAGGCVCCSFGSDLVAAMRGLAQRSLQPGHVLVETSGVALPDVVASTVALVPGFHADAVVVVVDAETIVAHSRDRYVGDTVVHQLRAADLVIVNKVDLAGDAGRVPLQHLVTTVAPSASRLDAVHANVPVDVLIGLHADATMSRSHIARTPPWHATFRSLALVADAPVDIASLSQALRDPACGVIRAKGVLVDCDGTPKALHIVGRRSSCTSSPAGRSTVHGLVCIGLRAALDADAVQRAFESAGGRSRLAPRC